MDLLELIEDMNETEREIYITLLLALMDTGNHVET